MKITKTSIILVFLGLLCLSINANDANMEEYLRIEREEFGTVTYNVVQKNGLSFLGEEPSPVNPIPSPSLPSPGFSFDKLIDGIAKSTNVYLKVVEAFKTKRTSEFVQMIDGKGFEHFAATGQIKMTKGVRGDKLGAYIELLRKIVKVPDEHKPAIDGVLETIEYAEKDFWNNFKNAFDIGQQNKAKFVSIYAYANSDKNTYDIMYLDFEGTFKLAPDTMVIKKSLMVLGGIWTDEQTVFERREKSLTPEIMDQVFDFFTILSFSSVGKVLGVKFEFPKF